MHKATHWSWSGQGRTERKSGICSAVSEPPHMPPAQAAQPFRACLGERPGWGLQHFQAPAVRHSSCRLLRQSRTFTLQRSRKSRSQPLSKSWREKHSMGAVLSLQAELPRTKVHCPLLTRAASEMHLAPPMLPYIA